MKRMQAVYQGLVFMAHIEVQGTYAAQLSMEARRGPFK